MDNKTENTNNVKGSSLFLKILIPVLVLGAIVGIYLIKNKEAVTDNVSLNEETSEENNLEETAEAATFELHVTEAIDLEELKSYGVPIMIDFGADSCVPCKEMAPVLEKLNEELQGKAIVLFVDVWKYHDLAADFPVMLIPTQVSLIVKVIRICLVKTWQYR